MALSSTSRHQRKSMLPKPRPSSRISTSRRVISGDTTSRIARRVPSPLLVAMSCNNNNNGDGSGGVTVQAVRVAGYRPAGPPSELRIPWSAGWSVGQTDTSSDSQDQSKAPSSLTSRSPSPEVKKSAADHVSVDVLVQYPTPPISAEIRHERIFFKGQPQEGRGLGLGRTVPSTALAAAQHQDRGNHDPQVLAVLGATAARLARRPSRRPASVSTALTLTNTFSRVDNASARNSNGIGKMPALTRKKSAFVSNNFSGKENQRPRMHIRVPPPLVSSALTIPPRSNNRRTAVAQLPLSRAAPFRETLPASRPLVIRKQLHPLAVVAGLSSPVRSDSDASGAVPVLGSVTTGIQALVGDIDRFAKEWTEMFDELSTGADDPEDRLSKLNVSTRIRPIGQPEDMALLQVDNPVVAAAGVKGTPRQLQQGTSGSPAFVNTLQASILACTNAETVHFDVTPESQTRWQHRDKSLAKDVPEDGPEKDQLAMVSASATDPQADKTHHHLLPEAVLRNASLQTTPQVSQHLSSLPEISQPSDCHLVDMTSLVLANGKDEAADLIQSTSKPPRGIDTARQNGILRQARYFSSATVPSVATLSAVSPLYSSPLLANLRANDFSTQCPKGDAAVPTRSSSMRGLRAILKRTSADRQRAESLKERISEPRVLSLGSISVSNLRDAGVASGCALPMRREESTMNTGDLTRITAVK